jgi:hypothetical protein
VERDKPKKSESVGQAILQLPWKQKRGDLKKIGFLSSNFMKLCRNIHCSVWQLLGGFCVKFQMDPLYGFHLTFFAPWLPWQQLPFGICSTPPPLKAATHYSGYSYKVS